MGPKVSAGKKVNPEKIRIIVINKPAKRFVSVLKVPDEKGMIFLGPSNPAI